MTLHLSRRTLLASAAALSLASALPAMAADVSLLNVSYDPTRELYVEVNAAITDSYGFLRTSGKGRVVPGTASNY